MEYLPDHCAESPDEEAIKRWRRRRKHQVPPLPPCPVNGFCIYSDLVCGGDKGCRLEQNRPGRSPESATPLQGEATIATLAARLTGALAVAEETGLTARAVHGSLVETQQALAAALEGSDHEIAQTLLSLLGHAADRLQNVDEALNMATSNITTYVAVVAIQPPESN